MSRPSRSRESIFSAAPDSGRLLDVCSSSIIDCVHALHDANAELHDAQLLLRSATADLQRVSHVLSSNRFFLFVNESTVRKYKSALADEIEPQIEELVDRAKKGTAVLQKRRNHLKAMAEHAPLVKATTNRSAAGRLEARRLQLLSVQRQRLERELQELQEDINALEAVADVES